MRASQDDTRDDDGLRRWAVIAASLLVPFLLEALLVIIYQELELWGSAVLLWDLLPLIVSVAVGYLLLARRYRRYAVMIGIVYVPIMFGVLIFFGLWLVGYLYDNHL